MKGQRSVIKDILFSLIIFIIFFVALEVQQRVRQYWKTGNEYYLFYGGDRASLFLKKIYYNTRILCRINIDKEKKGKADLVIAALGGSTTYWLGTPDNCYIEQIKVQLSQKFPLKKIEVYNWGAPGSASRRDFRRLRENLSRMPIDEYPDILIIHTGLNDAYMAEGVPKDGDSIYHPFYVRLNYILMHHSLFYRCVYEKVHNNRPIKEERLAHYGNADYERQTDYYMKRLKKNIYEMTAICKNNGIKAIFSLHPISETFSASGGPNEKRLIEVYKKMCGEIISVAREKEVPLVDLRGNMKEGRFYLDPIHFNIDGSKKAAELFLPVIISISSPLDSNN